MITALVVARGCWLILKNGVEEKIVFSHIVQIALNEGLLRAPGNVHNKARVQLERDASQRLLLTSSVDDLLDDSSSLQGEKYGHLGEHLRVTSEVQNQFVLIIFSFLASKSMAWKSDYSNRHNGGQWKMIVLILAASCCMAMHHFYYNYLDGRPPSATESLCLSGCSNSIRNQVVVSDVGIALAYATQAFLVAAIAISSAQVLWRRIRSRGITMSEIDALMRVCVNPFSPSSFRAIGTSFSVLLLALLASSLSFLSIFTPGSIKISDSFQSIKRMHSLGSQKPIKHCPRSTTRRRISLWITRRDSRQYCHRGLICHLLILARASRVPHQSSAATALRSSGQASTART